MESSGEQVNVVPVPHTFPLDTLEHEYVSGDATKTSRAVNVKNDVAGAFYLTLFSTGTPTDIIFELEFSVDGTNWFKKADTYWADLRFDDTVCSGSGWSRRYSFDLSEATGWIRIKATATGVGATETTSFTVSSAFLEMKSR
jgi:hypothetical protein